MAAGVAVPKPDGVVPALVNRRINNRERDKEREREKERCDM
jgi:hypothetical protein